MPAARGLPQVMLMEGPVGDQGWQVSQPGFVRMLWGWVLVIVLGLGRGLEGVWFLVLVLVLSFRRG